MVHDGILIKTDLRTPKAAAVAGIAFSTLSILAFGLLRIAIPDEQVPPTKWLSSQSSTIGFALNLIPFAGIAFLWFIGVLRDRLGSREDQLFATVFIGSGLLFLAILFAAAAVLAAIIGAFALQPDQAVDPDALGFANSLAYNLMNVYAIKMAGVFMISTSTVVIRTEFAPRYIGLLGHALALLLLLGSYYLKWSFFVFPLWVLLLSAHLLIDSYRREPQSTAA
jgi:MFS family permease